MGPVTPKQHTLMDASNEVSISQGLHTYERPIFKNFSVDCQAQGRTTKCATYIFILLWPVS